jgi:uridylate kinase
MFLTVGGGNIIRGKNFTGCSNADDAVDYAGMLASTQNALLLRKALLEHGSRSIVITPDNFTIPECFHSEDIRTDDRIVLLGGGLGIPGYSTDSSTVKNAAVYGCDEIIFLKMGISLTEANRNIQDLTFIASFPNISYTVFSLL